MDMEKNRGKEKGVQERMGRRLKKMEIAILEVFGEEEAIRRWEEEIQIGEVFRILGIKEEKKEEE
jgi:hypothetical protein